MEGERTGSTGKQFIQNDLQRIKPVETFWFRTPGDPFVVVAFAEIPQPHLVEVMETDGSSDAVDQHGVGIADADGDDVGEVDLEEVGLPGYWSFGYVPCDDEDEEDPGHEVEEGSETALKDGVGP